MFMQKPESFHFKIKATLIKDFEKKSQGFIFANGTISQISRRQFFVDYSMIIDISVKINFHKLLRRSKKDW